MAVSADQVLQIVKQKGPLIPATIAKDLSLDLLFAQAYLSELSSKKLVSVSSIKMGGSPLYFVDGQQSKLQDFSDNLNEKDARTYEKLKKEKVIMDESADPLTRVSLRQLRDYAVMLEVQSGAESKIFWKWYMCSNEEITPFVKKMLGQPIVEEKEPVKKESEPAPQQKEEPAPAVQQDAGAAAVRPPAPTTVVEEKPQPKPRVTQKKLAPQVTIETSDREADIQADIESGDEFLATVVEFFKKNKIDIHTHNIIRKNSDIEFTVSIPTAVGHLDFFCRAKNKKKCNDADLSSAYVQGILKHVPTLFLTTGELTKKAEEILAQDLNGMIVQYL